MTSKKLFQGSGGGGPTTTPDSLLSEDIVEFALAVSEGPIRGLTNGAASFYVGDTPLVSVGGQRNFDKFAIGVHPGFPEGSAKPLELKLGGISSNVTVGVALLKNLAVIRQTEAQLRGSINTLEVRLQFARLMRADDDGSTHTNTASFKVEYRAANQNDWIMFSSDPVSSTETYPEFLQDVLDRVQAGTQPGSLTVTGKTSSGYVKEFRAEVPIINDDWVIRVTKLSPDNDPHDVVDMSWESYQATSRQNLTFPNTAIVHGLGVANGQFSNIPDFSGVYDGLIIRVPSNYNPDTRTYDESTPWNGSFKFAWTNNPAWILYDLIVNDRYGLAKHRRYIDANRFTFYQAAKWCDEPVAIAGTTETRPRYTFNMTLSEARPGMEMLNYVAGSFNALVWDDLQGQIHLRVDKDDPAVMMFTPENVTEEGFTYSFSDLTARANDISVSFINPDLDWNEDRRRIPNVTTSEEHIEKHGRIPLDFIAVGCTNLHEAIAKAQVRLSSSLTETTMVSFTTTRQGGLLSLYDVVLIADPMMGWSQSGRLTSYDAEWLNFRDPIFIESMGEYVVKLQTVSGVLEITVTPETIGHVTRLRLQSELPADIPRYTVFTVEGVESSFGYAKPFRVLSITEVDGSPYLYNVTAVEINRNKYVQAESAPTDIGDDFDYSTKVPYLPGQPSGFTAVSGDEQILLMPSGEIVARILATWRKPLNSFIRSYLLQYKLVGEGDTEWQTVPAISGTSAYISPVVPGEHYTLRLASIDGNGQQSPWVVIADHLARGKTRIPGSPQSISATGGVFQIEVNWTFGSNPAPNLKKVELWFSTTNDRASASKLTDLAYPATSWLHIGLGVDVTVYYWVRVQDSAKIYSGWTGPASATTTKNASAILTLLENKITGTQLFTDLNTRINLIDAPETTVGSVAARILAEAQARASAITTAVSSEASSRQTSEGAISLRIDTVSAKTDNNAAAILTETQARTNADSALSTRIDTVQATTGTNTAAIQAETTARTTADTALGVRIDAVVTSVGANTSAIQNEVNARTTAIAAEATQRNEQIASYDYDIRTWTQTYTYSKATVDGALSQQYNTLSAEYKSYADAKVASYSYSKAQTDSAISGQVSQVTSRLNNIGGVTVEQAITTNANSINGLNAQYTVKIDSGGRVVGFGLASTAPVTGEPSSSFIVNADSFAVAFPGMTAKLPLMVGLVNGVQTVGVNGALIVDGTAVIKNANIENAAVDTLKVAGNSITGVIAAIGGADSVGAGSSTTLLTASITMPAGASGVVVTVSMALHSDNNSSQSMVILKNGNQVAAQGISLVGGFVNSASFSYADSNPTVGTTTYSFVVSSPTAGVGSMQAATIHSSSLLIQGAKR
jgi:predicted phage tail protein